MTDNSEKTVQLDVEFIERLKRIRENHKAVIQPDSQIGFLLDYIAELEQSEKDYATAERLIKAEYNAILDRQLSDYQRLQGELDSAYKHWDAESEVRRKEISGLESELSRLKAALSYAMEQYHRACVDGQVCAGLSEFAMSVNAILQGRDPKAFIQEAVDEITKAKEQEIK